MASKRDELRAFSKLCKAFPKRYCSLDLDMIRYSSDGEVRMTYAAYIDSESGTNNYLSKTYKTPIEAVNEILKHFKKGEFNETD